MKILIKRLTETAIMPLHGSSAAAGWDLYADVSALEKKTYCIKPHETVLVGTGWAVAIPEGYVGLIFARSGMASKVGLAPANKVGVIDSDYRGEIMVALHNHSNSSQLVAPGTRIAQMIVVPFVLCDYVVSEELSATERGSGGFGSTGTK